MGKCVKNAPLSTRVRFKNSPLFSPLPLCVQVGGKNSLVRLLTAGAEKNAQAHKKTPDAGASGVLGSVLRAAGCRPQREREY